MRRLLSLFLVLFCLMGCTGTVPTEFNVNDISAEALQYAETIVEQDGEYTAPAEVAAYLHIYEELPDNFITKSEAKKLGWNSEKGNLAEVAPGKSIGGDRFGNYEELLPVNTKYHECDINYVSGRRGAERIVYSSDMDIYYTDNHYETFTQLY